MDWSKFLWTCPYYFGLAQNVLERSKNDFSVYILNFALCLKCFGPIQNDLNLSKDTSRRIWPSPKQFWLIKVQDINLTYTHKKPVYHTVTTKIMDLIQSGVQCPCITMPCCPLLSYVFSWYILSNFHTHYYCIGNDWFIQILWKLSLLKWECSFEFISTHCAISFYFGNELSTSHPYICWLSLVAQWYQLFHSFLEKPTYYYALGSNDIWRSMLWHWKDLKVKTRCWTVLSKNRKLSFVFPFCFHQNQNNLRTLMKTDFHLAQDLINMFEQFFFHNLKLSESFIWISIKAFYM